MEQNGVKYEENNDFGAVFFGGGALKKDLSYEGDSLAEIAKQIQTDENNLLEYMRTHDFKGEKSFCFAGFMFQKGNIVAAQLTEPEI